MTKAEGSRAHEGRMSLALLRGLRVKQTLDLVEVNEEKMRETESGSV